MDILEAVARRHSVRSYTDKKIEGEVLTQLLSEIDLCNADSGLNIQLITNEPQAFSTKLAKEFKGVENYIALVGKKSADLEEKCGYCKKFSDLKELSAKYTDGDKNAVNEILDIINDL